MNQVENFLKSFQSLDLKPLPPSFWKKQEELFKEKEKKRILEKEALKMSPDKFRKPFSCLK